MQEDLIKELLLKEVDVEPTSISVLTGGQVGHVYRVNTIDKSFVVKFVDAEEEPSFVDEPRDDRVYGARWSNLLPTYNLLKENNISLPVLYASGTLAEKKLHYEIMDYLEGNQEDYSPEWFSVLGESLGKIHKIARSYQGWVGMEEPLSELWSNAFMKSLSSRLEESKPFIEESLYNAVSSLISTLGPITEPQQFVLSHTDGFQGIFKKNPEWSLVGVVDIEDYQFTDQRFALTGLELIHSFEGRALPNEFWESYTSHIAVDDTFEEYKKLFQLYYLLVWVRVLTNQPELLAPCSAMLASLVNEDIQ